MCALFPELLQVLGWLDWVEWSHYSWDIQTGGPSWENGWSSRVVRGERDGTGIGRQETLDNHVSSFPCGNKLLFQENFRIWSLEVKLSTRGSHQLDSWKRWKGSTDPNPRDPWINPCRFFGIPGGNFIHSLHKWNSSIHPLAIHCFPWLCHSQMESYPLPLTFQLLLFLPFLFSPFFHWNINQNPQNL